MAAAGGGPPSSRVRLGVVEVEYATDGLALGVTKGVEVGVLRLISGGVFNVWPGLASPTAWPSLY